MKLKVKFLTKSYLNLEEDIKELDNKIKALRRDFQVFEIGMKRKKSQPETMDNESANKFKLYGKFN